MNVLRNVSFDAASEMKLQSFRQNAPKVFRRDNCKCAMCGFTSKLFLRILPFNGEKVSYDKKSYQNPIFSSFKTVCSLCYEANRLGYALDKGLGVIIYFPELSQKEINMLFHTYLNIICEDATSYPDEVRKNISHLKNQTRREYSIISSREKSLLEVFGSANSKELVSFFSLLSDSAYDKHSEKIMSGLRYLPDLDAYETRGKKWKGEVYASIAIPQWEKLLKSTDPDLYDTWLTSISKEESDVVFPRIKINE